MKKALALALFAICAAPLFASVDLDTSIADVFNRGSNELAGSITWTVDGDDFREASTDTPIFMRITPDHNSFLAETLVHQTGNDADLRDPILLAMRLDGGNGVVTMNALPEAVSIVRWVAGESSFWIQVQQTSDQWLSGALGPDPNNEVSWTVGISARVSDNTNEDGIAVNGSNLPFNTRVADAAEGQYHLATSTLLCVDLSSSNLEANGNNESVLQYDIIAFDEEAEIGTGIFSGQAGNQLNINFSDDRVIARGKARACSVIEYNPEKSSVVSQALCVDATGANDSAEGLVELCSTLTLEIDCETGGNYLTTELVPGAYVTFDTNGKGRYGFREEDNVSFINRGVNYEIEDMLGQSYVDTDSRFVNNEVDLYSFVTLEYTGENVPLTSVRRISIELCVWQHYTDDPIDATVDWELILVNHDGAEDLAVNPDTGEMDYDGRWDDEDRPNDQYRRCAPSEFSVGTGEYLIGYYVECTGNPVSIFFPYVPRLIGQGDFWVGLSYVNQGAVELDVEARFYDEDGNLFTGDLGSLSARAQKTWLLAENGGIATLTGAGGNNDGETVTVTAGGEAPAESFGTTRSSLFLRGTFNTEFFQEQDLGDLDGYMLVGNLTTLSIDGAYLPRNYDNGQTNQDADLPIWRSKRSGKHVLREITSDRPARFR